GVDRSVREPMRAVGYTPGGEQSGHIVFTDHATTGDGVLTALQLAAQVVRSGQSFGELAGSISRLPQVLINVSGVDKARAASDEALAEAVAASESRRGHTSRGCVRPPGTEPLVRVMVEAATAEQAQTEARGLADVVKDRLALE